MYQGASLRFAGFCNTLIQLSWGNSYPGLVLSINISTLSNGNNPSPTETLRECYRIRIKRTSLACKMSEVADREQVLCYLDGVEGGALLDLIGDDPKGNAAGVGEVAAYSTYVYGVAAGDHQGHGVLALSGVVDHHQAGSLLHGVAHIGDLQGLGGAHPYGLAVGAEHRHTHAHGRHVQPGGVQNLAGLALHLHLLVGVVIVEEGVDLRDEIAEELCLELADFQLVAGGIVGNLPFKLGHAGGTGAGSGLVGSHVDALYGAEAVDGCQGHEHLDGCTVGVADDVARAHEGVGGIDLGHYQGHVGVHAESRRVVDHHGSAGGDDVGVFLRHGGTGADKGHLEAGEKFGVVGELLDHVVVAAKGVCASGGAGRAEETESVDGKGLLVEYAQQLLAHGAAGAYYCNVHSWEFRVERRS